MTSQHARDFVERKGECTFRQLCVHVRAMQRGGGQNAYNYKIAQPLTKQGIKRFVRHYSYLVRYSDSPATRSRFCDRLRLGKALRPSPREHLGRCATCGGYALLCGRSDASSSLGQAFFFLSLLNRSCIQLVYSFRGLAPYSFAYLVFDAQVPYASITKSQGWWKTVFTAPVLVMGACLVRMAHCFILPV